MRWKVKTKDGELNMGSSDVANTLMSKVYKTQKQDVEVLANYFAEFLERNSTLCDVTARQLSYMCMMMGYYYRIFLEKNTVDIEGEDAESSGKTGV